MQLAQNVHGTSLAASSAINALVFVCTVVVAVALCAVCKIGALIAAILTPYTLLKGCITVEAPDCALVANYA